MDGGLHHQRGLACAGLADDQEGAALAEPAVAEDGVGVVLAVKGHEVVEGHTLRAVLDLGALALVGESGIVLEQGVRVGGLGGDERRVSEDGRVGDELDVLRAVGVEACVGRQVGDVGRPDGRTHAPKVFGDGEFVGGRAVDL